MSEYICVIVCMERIGVMVMPRPPSRKTKEEKVRDYHKLTCDCDRE